MIRAHTQVTTPLPLPDPGSPNCQSVSEVLSRIGDKWSVQIVIALGAGPRRFNELRRSITGVSQRMLTLTLRSLERDGLVARTQFPTIPPRVDYALTDLGRSLWPPVEALGQWAIQNISHIHQARQQFDRAAVSPATAPHLIAVPEYPTAIAP